MPILRQSAFVPAWWLRNPHLQTLWASLARRAATVPATRERLDTPDGDFLELDHCGDDADAPIVMLLHGLSGSSRSSYIVGMQAALARRGWRSAALNFRGCGGRPNLRARGYHAGDTEDLEHLYRHLRRLYPNAPLAAVGYSLGGNMLLKWLGERGAEADMFGAVAVSAPLRLNLCSERLNRGFSRVYRDRLLYELRAYLRAKREHLRAVGAQEEWEKLRRLGDLSGVRTFREYDDVLGRRLYGFRDAEDFYRRASARPYIRSIRVSTLIVHALDDPFMPPETLPAEEELSPAVSLEVAAHGGHVGFIAGRFPHRPQYWLERRIPEFLDGALSSPICPHTTIVGAN